jgi:hypothetical protein
MGIFRRAKVGCGLAAEHFIGKKLPFTENWRPVNGKGLFRVKGRGTFVL